MITLGLNLRPKEGQEKELNVMASYELGIRPPQGNK